MRRGIGSVGRGGLHVEKLEGRILLSVSGLESGFDFLAEQAAQFTDTGDVYTEADSGGNLYAPSGWMNVASGGLEIDAADTEEVYAGEMALEISWDGSVGDDGTRWAAVMFEWPDGLTAGTRSGAGWDLSGATELSFAVRSEDPGESIIVGFGDDVHDPVQVRQRISLQTDWTHHTIQVGGADVSDLNGGFIVAFDAWSDAGAPGVTLHVDEVAYDAAPPAHHLLQSYRPDWAGGSAGVVYRNTAFTYDNALAAVAHLSAGADGHEAAGEILDAFHWGLHNEEIDSGLEEYVGAGEAFLRSGYSAGPLEDPASGRPRAAGWTDEGGTWHPLEGTLITGNNAWAMIALLNGYRHLGDSRYLEDATLIGNWIHNHWHDPENGGYEMGLGRDGALEPWPGHIKSTEHNIDLFSAFSLLADSYEELGQGTQAATWRARAGDAGEFVLSMERPGGGFRTGTGSDGVTPNDGVHVLDPQSWSVLAFSPWQDWQGEADWAAALDYAEVELGATDAAGTSAVEGFDFGKAVGQAGEPDGVWLEGTAQMAAAYAAMGSWAPSEHYLRQLRTVQENHPAGDGAGLVSAASDGLSTGFDWEYNARLHVGATAWAMMANEAYNPFTASWMDQPRSAPCLGMAIPSWWHDKYEGLPAAEALLALADTGADVVEFTPAWYQNTIHSSFLGADPQKTASDAGVRRMIQLAHDLEMEVLLKPHVELWDGGSRTEIAPDDPSAWFDSYTDFALHYAAIAEEEAAECFSVGTELASMSGAQHLVEWQEVIGAVENVYGGRTVYAANHDEYTDVAFWDEVDLIGLDAYFDLGATVPHSRPDADELRQAWEPVLADVTAWLAENHPGRQMLITEIGYRNISDAHVRPWEAWREGEPDEATQAACYEAALDAWGERLWVEGMIFWTWPNNLDEDIPQNKPQTGYVPYDRMAEQVFRAAATGSTGRQPRFAPVRNHLYGLEGVRVSLYDIDDSNGVISPEVAWSWSEFRPGTTDVVVEAGGPFDRAVNQIMLFGRGDQTEDLGIVVEGNSRLDAFIDVRTGSTPIGFLASEGSVGYVSAPAGVSGADLNGWTIDGGWALPEDVDGDGSQDDHTAVYTGGRVDAFIGGGDIGGGLVAETGVGFAMTQRGDWAGDLIAHSNAVGQLLVIDGDIDLEDGRRISSASTINSIQAINGDLLGDGEDGTREITVENGSLWSLMAINGKIDGISAEVRSSGGASWKGTIGTILSTGSRDGIDRSCFDVDRRIDHVGVHGPWRRQGGRWGPTGDLDQTTFRANALGSVSVSRTMRGTSFHLTGGSLQSLSVMRDIEDSTVSLRNGSGALSGRLDSVYVNGDTRDTAIEAGSLGNLYVRGWAERSGFFTSGNMGSVTVGAARDTTCFAGVKVTHDWNGDGVLDLPDPATELNLTPGGRASIGSVRVTGLSGGGDWIINSNLAAAQMHFVHVIDPRNDNDGVPFGVAADRIGTYLWVDGGSWEVYSNMDGPEDSHRWDDSEIRVG